MTSLFHGKHTLHELARDEGLAGVRKMFGPLFGLGANAAVAAKYQALERLPAGTFGRAFREHIAGNGFAFPGEKGGFPERGLFHDLGHVLSGYGTDPGGEIQQAAFQSGFMRNDGFAFLFFGIVQFHLGVKVTPIADPEVGLFDVDKVMTALARGAACKVDLSDRWDFWPLLPRPLEEVRAELGIPPLA
jgi:ubiquinone biosynthesis protein Coq4